MYEKAAASIIPSVLEFWRARAAPTGPGPGQVSIPSRPELTAKFWFRGGRDIKKSISQQPF